MLFFMNLLNFLTSQTLLESYQPILGPSDMCNLLKAKKKVCVGGGWVETKNRVLLRSRSLSFKFSELDLT